MILHYQSPIERALTKACRSLTLAYDYDYCPDDQYFAIIEELHAALERRKSNQLQKGN